jgi:hypothetical protein
MVIFLFFFCPDLYAKVTFSFLQISLDLFFLFSRTYEVLTGWFLLGVFHLWKGKQKIEKLCSIFCLLFLYLRNCVFLLGVSHCMRREEGSRRGSAKGSTPVACRLLHPVFFPSFFQHLILSFSPPLLFPRVMVYTLSGHDIYTAVV